jgi:hypothetical protein
VLGCRFKSSKIADYSSDLNLQPALVLGPIEGFETTSINSRVISIPIEGQDYIQYIPQFRKTQLPCLFFLAVPIALGKRAGYLNLAFGL